MRFIGKEHCCAEMSKVDEFIVSKEISEDKIIEMIDRITLQLAELSLSFKKFKNTITIFPLDMTLLFYYYNGVFYVSSDILPKTIQIISPNNIPVVCKVSV
jgi:hypothetical protein